MSFPRAKIQRFNDVNPNTPSPADYNPLNSSNPTGAIILKGSRFVESKSPPGSMNTSISSANSLNRSSCFRTPQLLKKKKSPRDMEIAKSSESFMLEKEALKDKMIECQNKDQTITDLSEYINEMKEKLNGLQHQYSDLCEVKTILEREKQELHEKYKHEKEELVKHHEKENSKITQKINELLIEFQTVKKQYKEMSNANEFSIASLRSDIDNCKDLQVKTINYTETQIQDRDKKLEELSNEIENMKAEEKKLITSFESRMEDMKNQHSKEIKKEEDTLALALSEAQKAMDVHTHTVQNLQEEIKKRQELYENLLADKNIESLEKEIKELKEKYNSLEEQKSQELRQKLEQQEELLEKNYAETLGGFKESHNNKVSELQNKIDALKEQLLNKTTEYNIALSNYEVCLKDYENVNKKCINLENDIDHKTAILKKLQEEIDIEINLRKDANEKAVVERRCYESEIDKLLGDIKNLKSELHKYHVVVANMTSQLNSIQSQNLCDHLQTSITGICEHHNADIDIFFETIFQKFTQLQNKIEQHENTFRKYILTVQSTLEKTNNDMLDSRECLRKQTEINSKIDLLLNSASTDSEKLNGLYYNELNKSKALVTDFNSLQHIVARIRSDSQKLEDFLEKYTDKINQDEELIKNLKSECRTLRLFNVEVDDLYTKMQETAAKIKSEYKQSKVKTDERELEATKLSEKYRDLEEELQSLRQRVEEIDALRKRNLELEKIIAEQESLIGPFREQLEDYEREHKALLGQKTYAENELKEMGLKYAEILGHQNHKQKIKHLVDIKKKNFDLQQSNQALEGKIRSQGKMIEKLKQELAASKNTPRKNRMSSNNKENVFSPNRTLNSTQNVTQEFKKPQLPN